jgi:hypothetical protein
MGNVLFINVKTSQKWATFMTEYWQKNVLGNILGDFLQTHLVTLQQSDTEKGGYHYQQQVRTWVCRSKKSSKSNGMKH